MCILIALSTEVMNNEFGNRSRSIYKKINEALDSDCQAASLKNRNDLEKLDKRAKTLKDRMEKEINRLEGIHYLF